MPSLFSRSFGGPGPAGTLIMLHATGLNASAYGPLLKALAFDGLAVSVSLRGHGATDLPADPEKLQSWQLFADDIAEMIEPDAYQRPLILAGHSAGAVTALLAASALRPDHLVMMEPVVLPRLAVALARGPLKRFTVDRISIAKRAGARRARFGSRAEVEAAYRSKRFFAAWHPEAFEGYLDEGLRTLPDGGVELACAPAYEKACFTAQAAGFWPHLRSVRAERLPVSILATKERSTFPQKRHQRARDLGASVTLVEGQHMLPLIDPNRVAAWMTRELQP